MRRTVLNRALASAALALGTVAFAPSATAAQTSETFKATGAAQSFTVPTSVRCISVNAYGAAGGNSTTSSDPGASGGLGGRAIAQEVPVVPGEVLTVLVGTQGGDGDATEAGAGGFQRWR